MNRSELLAQWAELAPWECHIEASCCQILYRGVLCLLGPGKGILRDRSIELDNAVLLSAIIEAIRARGWHYSLFSGDNAPEHTALTYTVDDFVPATRSSEKEPCDALLAAYVNALTKTT